MLIQKSSQDRGPDELYVAACSCLARLFESIARSSESKRALLDTANVPALGHAVTVILDGAVKGQGGDEEFAVEAAVRRVAELAR